MAVAFVKRTQGQTATNVTTFSASLPSAPDVGSLLVFKMAGDKNCGALTLAGFTQVYALTSTSVSLYYCYKISDGSETTINPSWANTAVNGNTFHYAEYDDASISGSTWQISAQASNPTSETNVTSCSTGTTGAATAAGLAIAMIALDSADSVVDGTTAWTQSYSPRYTTLNSAGARGGIHVAEKAIAASATTETTFSFTASTTNRDQLSGAVVVFTKTSSDAAVSARTTGAAGLYAVTEQSPTPDSRTDAAAHLAAITTKNITPGSMLVAGAHLSAVIGHAATVEARLDSGARLHGTLSAGPNDVSRDARLTAGAQLRAVVAQSFPPPVPAGRTYRVAAERRVYRIPREGTSVAKVIHADDGDDLDYQYDWDDVLDDGETIADSVVEPPDGITAHNQTDGVTTVDVWFSGGTPGRNYRIPNRITTSAGRVYERNIELRVRDL